MLRRRCALRCESEFASFSFPKDEAVKNQWLKFIFTTIPQQYNHNLLLCSHHFTDDCFSNLCGFNVGYINWLSLKDGSVPTAQFVWTSMLL